MIPWDADVFLNALKNSEGGVSSHVHKERISTSAKRVLQLKDDLNMFEETITFDDNANTHMKPNPDEIQKVLDMTHQSIILTENKDSTLPISLPSDASGEQQPLKVRFFCEILFCAFASELYAHLIYYYISHLCLRHNLQHPMYRIITVQR